MSRSFGLVDDKLAEAAFFFERLESTQNMFEARCYLSAFASASRSVTFAMQASLVGVEGFANAMVAMPHRDPGCLPSNSPT